MDTSPIYQTPSSRDYDSFSSDLHAGAIETANRYIEERINSSLTPEERIVVMTKLADELSVDSGNRLIVEAIRNRIILEKQSLELQLSSSVI